MTWNPLAPLAAGLILLAAPAAAQKPHDSPDAATAAGHAGPAGSLTVLDGVYTEEQAERGREIFGDYCAVCHGGNLRGTWNMGPSIVGFRFERNWVDRTVADLFAYIREEMPQDDPGTLSDTETAALLAYILARNDYPAGADVEIPLDPDAQELITIIAR